MTSNKILYTLAAVALFTSGYWLRGYLHTCPLAEPEVITNIEYKDRVKTEIAYVPKETVIYKDGTAVKENTDIDLQIGKPELNVKVNGKPFTVQKEEDERYIFDKNKLSLTQTSSADLHISVPTIDKTKRWEIGIGASKDGMAGLVGFPIKGNVGGWVAGNKDYAMGGVTLKF